ncbi:cytochrome P450 18a1 [Trichonephila clavipes]|uniref:Cytochrome P450 18a1 n=1 Tax=Trichonephila clavipes TaxID=2585209 RepID=A0A8X6V4R2_TRICX|nr:cytochrome P450 18a1 [Trichonephila clavipes]
METITALLLGSLVALILIWFLSREKRKTLPGPYGLPIVGYIPFIGSQPYVTFQKLAKIYGPVFTIQLGSRNVIVLDDFQAAKDAFIQDAFMGRPPENPFDLRKATLETGAFNGLPWKEQRRFSLHMLKDLGFGKSHLEDMIKEEISDLLNHLAKMEGKPTIIRSVLAPSMSNNIAVLVFGKRYKYDDPIRKMLDRTLNESAAAAGQVAWQLFFPELAKLLKFLRIGSEGKIAKVLKESRDHTK